MKTTLKRIIKSIFLLVLLNIILIFSANYVVEQNTKAELYNSIHNLPKHKVGLVLGTSKTLFNGNRNLYFTYRIQATVKLYKAGKIEYVLVSGDNSREGYDEPTDFKEELMRQGIPEDRIYLDYAGFRTLDSVVRANKIFGLTDFIVISQKFHNERALYLANHYDLDAVGFNAKDVSLQFGLKVQLREYLARVKLFLDLLIGKSPKFLGEKIKIGN